MVSNYTLAKNLFNDGKISEAKLFIDFALETDSRNIVFFYASKIYNTVACKKYEETLVKESHKLLKESVDFAEQALKSSYKSLKIEAQRNLAETYYLCGNILGDNAFFKKSYLTWRKVLMHVHPSLKTYSDFLNVLIPLEREKEVLNVLDHSFRLDPHAKLSKTLYHNKWFDFSVSYAKEKIRRCPDKAGPYITLSDVLIGISRMHFSTKYMKELKDPLYSAYLYAKKAVFLQPKNAEGLSNLIVILNDLDLQKRLPEKEDIQKYLNQLEKVANTDLLNSVKTELNRDSEHEFSDSLEI